MLKQKISPIGEGEAMGPSPKKRNTADMATNQALEASANVKGEGAPVNQDAQEGVMEGDSKSPEVYPQEREEVQFKPAPGDATLPALEDSLPDEILNDEDGDDNAGAGASASHDNSESTEDDTEITSVEISHFIVNPVDPEVINYGIKHALMSEIRRYGRQYGRIFKLLDEVRGPLDIRLHFVRFAIKEAARFKRYHLIYYLEKLLEKMMSDSTIRNVDLNSST
ncbi:integrator complex subunit 6-like [Alexandromys fortis]|uniref:integrator complex subunit 6-like n=1 Tax=Alexandromys fortis TaxID=100897 RepID=UPI002152A171|nr:integrator complex subunit 6-like [Microtus fortis]XP_050015637.1 integrator complex subunit 6-like [Microtus fortis]XP_050015638.1 integrator complex subunit 6-like [Microtus fortis]